MKVVDKIVYILLKITEVFLILFSVIMVFAMFMQVMSRHMGISMSWTEELARFTTVWLIFIGSSLLAHFDEHINVTVLDSFLKGRVLAGLHLLRRLVYLAYSVIIVVFGFQAAAAVANQTSPNMFIPMNFIYICIPLGSLLTSFYLIVNIIQRKPVEGGSVTND